MDNHKVQRMKKQRFVGITLNERYTGVAQTKKASSSVTGRSNAFRKLTSTRSGSSVPALLRLHDSHVVCQIVYSLPYNLPSAHKLTSLERIHRAEINIALVVPRSTSAKEIYYDTSALPTEDVAFCRLISQLCCLHLTVAGRQIVERIQDRPGSFAAKRLEALRGLVPHLHGPCAHSCHGKRP